MEQLTRKEIALISGIQCVMAPLLTKERESRQMVKLEIQEKAVAQKIALTAGLMEIAPETAPAIDSQIASMNYFLTAPNSIVVGKARVVN